MIYLIFKKDEQEVATVEIKHISCVENGKIRSVEDINDDIYAVIKERLS